MAISSQKKLENTRKPRVHITYDQVAPDGERKRRELPFMIGVLSDLAGNAAETDPQQPLKGLKNRKFVSVDKNSFDDVMAKIGPRLKIEIKDASKPDDPNAKIPVEMQFNSMDDFTPAGIVRQSKDMNALLQRKKVLLDLIARLSGNDELVASAVEALKAGKAQELVIPAPAEEKATEGAPAAPAGGSSDTPPAAA